MLFRKNQSLLTQLSVWYIGSTFLLVASASLYLYWSLVKTLEQKDVQLLSDRLQTIRLLLGPGDPAALKQRVESEWVNRKFERLYVMVSDAQGRTIAETPGISPAIAQIVDKMAPTLGHDGPSLQSFSFPAEEMVFRAVAAPVSARAGQPPFTVKLVLDRSNEEQVLALHRQRLYIVLFVTALLCVLIGRRLAARAVEPINGMARTAARIRSSTLHERMEAAEMPEELGLLAGTFNGMMDRLEEAFARMSRFCADLAHELRTPIGNIIGELEVSLGRSRDTGFYRDTIGSALEECQSLARIIDALLFLARAEDPSRQLKKESVDLRGELRTVLEFYEAAAAEAGISFALTVEGAIALEVERTLFHRAVGNVVANAIRHAPGSGELTVSARREDRSACIEVRDHGPGIPAQHLARIFDRFYRVDASRTKESGGTGLGLAIVRSIATIHGGRVEIESEIGKGTAVRFFLPYRL